VSNGLKGGQPGNQNAANAKKWQAAVERAIERLARGQLHNDDPDRSDFIKGMDMLAEHFIEQRLVEAHAMPFYRELGDRIDGKAAQAITGADGAAAIVINATLREERL
jgi:hypothetical protein